MENKKILTTWQAACIITGYGIGGGVMSMPYLAQKAGLVPAMLILVFALFASYVLHLMIAEVSLRMDEGEGGQLISCLNRFLFKGKYKNLLTVIFCVLMLAILLTNLAAYITGAEEIMVELLPVSGTVCKIVFYVFAASVVLFGLKAVGISEGIAVPVIFALIFALAAGSLNAEKHAVNLFKSSLNGSLAFYGMAMYALSAFFGVPQAVEGLKRDEKEIKKALFLGFFNNFVIIIIVTVFALLSSKEITEVAMVGWSAGIGSWAQIIGGAFTVLAMITTYWSLSLALASIVQEQFSWSYKLCYLAATVPSFILALFNFASFMSFMRTAGGLISIIIAVMIVPAYRNARKECGGAALLGRLDGKLICILIIASYILMGIGSIVPV